MRRCGPVDISNDTRIRSCSSGRKDILIFCSDARSEICFLEFIYLSSGECAQEINFRPRERNLQNMTNWRHLPTLESDETRCLKSILKVII